jgi:hypothetical protein
MENSMPSARTCLSERAKELPDSDSCLLSVDLRPQSPPQATSLERLLKTSRPRMQISPAARQDLAMIDCYSPITGHDAEEPVFVVPSPAPDAGTNGRRHRNRLTPHHLQGGLSRVCRLRTAPECSSD